MFEGTELKNHFETSGTIQTESLVLAEWNMNMPDNISKLGNYRYRTQEQNSQFLTLPNTFDSADAGLYYTGATDADVVIDGGFESDDTPQVFTSVKEKVKLLYSLEDCIKPFRPRSGINKAVAFKGKFLANSGSDIARRPRYYMASRYDQFKYFTSFRTENNIERGIAKLLNNDIYYIDDTVPFVVYKENVPTNRIIVKMQTGVGDINLGDFTDISKTFPDPFFGNANKSTPTRWKIQSLDGNNWVDAYAFNENDTREDGSAIISHDGYVELQYGLTNIPALFTDTFVPAETFSSATLLPSESINGYAYLVIQNSGDAGTYHVWNGVTEEYETFSPVYGWTLGKEEINNKTSFVTDLTNPLSFQETTNGKTIHREFQNIRGLRIVVERMNKAESTFDLIEMSPRLVVDISNKTIEYSIKKILSDLGNSALPVGQLLASTGSISLFDDDQAFNDNNSASIVKDYIRKNIKFNFYEKILNVEGFDYWVPIKTLFSDGFPQADVTAGTLTISLRDFYFFLESMPAPRIMVTEASLSYGVSLILDYIGFSNYAFYRTANEPEPIIPYFFIAPDQTVAEVLNQLAVSTQTAMFFDEYNNLIIMSKDYMLPSAEDRSVNMTLSGSNNQAASGIIENQTSGTLPNIISIAAEDKKVYNNGKINYTTRYIQRSYGSVRQANKIDADKTWIYKPALLWEISGTDQTKTINEVASKQGKYVLGAMPLNSDIPAVAPSVVGNKIQDNILDLGENVYWLTRYQGYFYSNGEIIKYDAAQFSVTLAIWYSIQSDGKTLDETKPYIVLPGRLAPISVIDALDERVASGEITEAQKGQEIQAWRVAHRQGNSNVWITNNQEYQNYFKSLPFNGKIYPTGIVRIYAEPKYEDVDGITRLQNGPVSEHGRAQFGTQITSHSAGINTYWSENEYVKGCNMKTEYLFTTKLLEDINPPATTVGAAGVNFSQTITSNSKAQQTTRDGTIRNFMSSSFTTETPVNNSVSTKHGTIQSSALVMNGPSFTTTETPINLVSYVYKELDNKYKHFGTRMRIVGKIENNENRGQTPTGLTVYYQVPGPKPSDDPNISGGSGGLAVLLNPETNNGYYFEIVALTQNNVESYLKLDKNNKSNISINNVLFYKIKKDASNNDAIPIKLYGGLAKITVDDGRFTGQYRMAGEETTTVYDLAVEYEDIGKIRRFFLYINNELIKVVDDPDPLKEYNYMAPFVRGSSRIMFENIYALSQNYTQNSLFTVGETLSSAFGNKEITLNESLRKYAMSGIIQSTYLSGVSAQQPPKYNMYFDEFGSIMRECAYFDIKYDRAYPALYAQLSPTFNKIKGYVSSGFYADSYGAEFLIFNATDTALNLDESSGNYLKIQGVTFTQDTTHELTVDEYFKKRSNFSNPTLDTSSQIISPLIQKQAFDNIKISRMIYGNNEFTLDTPYIQTQDDAENLMGWMINKLMVPKKSIGIKLFATPIIQLGDIVKIDYKDSNNLNLVTSDTSRFVVYNIEYTRKVSGPDMTLYLAEV